MCSINPAEHQQEVFLLMLQALKFAKEAVEGYEVSTAASRESALDATRQAADFSQLAHKLMRAVYKAK